MSISTEVIGLTDPEDPTYKKMLALKRAFDAAGGDPGKYPKVLVDYYAARGADPCDEESALEVQLPLRDWSTEMREGYELDVADIPPGLKTIRFFNSY